MNDDRRRQDLDQDSTSRTTHPAPAQSPRPLGSDGLPERNEEMEERIRREPDGSDRLNPPR